MSEQKYLEMVQRHRKELEDFPMAFAFNKEQVEEGLKKLGAKDVSECVTVMDMGDFMLKKDIKSFKEMGSRHMQETMDFLKDKQDAEDAFFYEMNNHEYAINWSGDSDVLGCFGLTGASLKSMGLQDAYYAARRRHMDMMEKNGVI